MDKMTKHKAFISYHHGNDHMFKEQLLRLNNDHQIFIDMSVDTGDIDKSLGDQIVRQKIRDDYLKDSTVTIVLVGTQTKERKHVDWEIYSSIFDGKINKRSGILVIQLPSIYPYIVTTSHEAERKIIYPHISNWKKLSFGYKYENDFPYLPARIIDNLCTQKPPRISITDWKTIINNPEKLRWLINATYEDRFEGECDLSEPMRSRNSPETRGHNTNDEQPWRSPQP